MQCQPIIAAGQWTCTRCGFSKRTRQTDPALINRHCTGPRGLGDYLAAFFGRLRIPKCTPCARRQQQLNRSAIARFLGNVFLPGLLAR